MRHPQILVYEWDDLLTGMLEELAHSRRWTLHAPRQRGRCLEYLQASETPTVLVLRLGRNLEQELSLLEHIAWLYPETRLVVVGEKQHEWLMGLAWDLGADYVLLLPYPPEALAQVVAGLMGPGPPVHQEVP